MLGTGFHGVAGLAAESAHAERHGVAFDQPVVEPGHPSRGDLRTKIEIGTSREHQGGARVPGLTEAPNFDDATNWWRLFEGLGSARGVRARLFRRSGCRLRPSVRHVIPDRPVV